MPILVANGKRILYIHLPKTGGTTVTSLMQSYGSVCGRAHRAPTRGSSSPQHLHGEPLRNLFAFGANGPAMFDYVFTTVRDPIARIESEYAYQRLQIAGRRYRARQGFVGRASPPIDPWFHLVYARFRADQHVHDNHIRPQSEFLALGAEVFRLEDGLEQVERKLDHVTGMQGVLGAYENVGRLNSAERWHLSRRGVGAARRFYRVDFETFGYE